MTTKDSVTKKQRLFIYLGLQLCIPQPPKEMVENDRETYHKDDKNLYWTFPSPDLTKPYNFG